MSIWAKALRFLRAKAQRRGTQRSLSGRIIFVDSKRPIRFCEKNVARLVALAIELFDGQVSATLRWFTEPNRALGGLAPVQAAATEIGAREVEDLIGRLEHGVFT